MGKLAERFYGDRRLIALTVLLALASGVSSLMILPRMEDPLLTQRAANVVTIFPGADAERVEALVTEKIEDKLIDVPEIKRIRSQSRVGSSFITIELLDSIYDTEPVWSTIRGKIEDSIVDLPEGAGRPIFDELDIAAYAWIGSIVWDRDGVPVESVLRRLARDLKDRLFAVDGTKSVDLFGDPGEEIVVEIDPNKAAAAGLSPAAVAQQLAARDVKSSVGALRGDASDVVVELGNEFETLADIQSASLTTSQPGVTASLEDIATVRRGPPSPPDSRSFVDGKLGVVVAVMLRPEYRIDRWAAESTAVVERFAEELPPGLQLDVIMEQERYVADRLTSLARNLLLGVSAVALLTLFFMGWRSALLVTATLPVASLMVVAGMRALDIPIHQMSVTGLIIALGLMIDNAIIATDEIQISLRRGLSPREAVGDMVSRLFAPLLASTMTTALAFAPIALMAGPAGEFVGAIAITVMLAIFSSLFLAMTVLPATAALLQANNYSMGPDVNATPGDSSEHETSSSGKHGFWREMWLYGVHVPWLTRRYRTFLTFMVHRPWVGVAIGCALPCAGFIASTWLDEQFFPPADRDQFHIELELAPQASIRETEALARRIEAAIREEPRVRGVSWFLGESAPPFYYNVIARRKNSPNYGQAIVTLDNNRRSTDLIRQLQLRLDDLFPEARVLVRQLEQGPPFDAPVEIRVSGSDLERLVELGDELRAITTTLPHVLHTRTMLSESRPVATVDVDSRVASWTGLTEQDIAQQLFARFEGLPAGSIIEAVEQVPVRVRIAEPFRSGVEDVSQAEVLVSANAATQTGQGKSSQQNLALSQFAPLEAVARLDFESQRAVVTRYDGRRVNEVQTFITAGTLPSRVLNALVSRIEDSGFQQRLPAGYKLEVGGEASERDAAVSRLMANVSVLAVGMVGALVLALASFRLAGLIGVVAALSIGLGMGALWVFGYPFGFMAIVGTMGLIGIAINDSIVVVAALKQNERVMVGDVAATVDTIVEVTRHVLATTGTTVFGFLPLLISGGGFWPPLAVAIGTGVVGATLISVTLVPSVFQIMTRNRRDLALAAG